MYLALFCDARVVFSLLFVFMNPVDLLGAKISIRVRIGFTHPYIEKCSPLSLPETPTVNVKACIITHIKREKGLCGVADRFITAAKVCDCVVSGLVDRQNSGMWSRGWAVAPKYSVPAIKTFCQCLSSLIVPWKTNSRLWRIPIENNKHPNFEWKGQGRGADSFVLRNYPN